MVMKARTFFELHPQIGNLTRRPADAVYTLVPDPVFLDGLATLHHDG